MTTYRWVRHRILDEQGVDRTGLAPVSLWWAARAAAEETLQGAPLVASWLKLFRTHLSEADGYWLRWRGGFAESAELRRAYSGLYGRFFARALLAQHLKFTRFVSLQRNGIELPMSSVRVRRTAKGDIPDWLAWDEAGSRFVLCEAKGSLTAKDFLHKDGPKCVLEGKKQFDRVKTFVGGHRIHPAQWVSASRWATDDRGGEPITALWDPPAGGTPFGEDDARRYRAAMTLSWLDSIAPGLGYRTAGDLMSSNREGDALVVEAMPGPIPESDDWPRSGDGMDLLDSALPTNLVSSSVQQEIRSGNSRLVAALGDGLSDSAVYRGGPSLLVPAQQEKQPYAGKYVSALVTRFGIQPIRGKSDMPAVLERQARARDGEEPAMLIGIPMGIDPFETRGKSVWEDGAGIAPDGDLAVFDLRRITVESLA